MKTITLSGISFIAWSPSLFSLRGGSKDLCIGFDGKDWRIAVDGVYSSREWESRDQAVALVADAFAGRELTVHVS